MLRAGEAMETFNHKEIRDILPDPASTHEVIDELVCSLRVVVAGADALSSDEMPSAVIIKNEAYHAMRRGDLLLQRVLEKWCERIRRIESLRQWRDIVAHGANLSAAECDVIRELEQWERDGMPVRVKPTGLDLSFDR